MDKRFIEPTREIINFPEDDIITSSGNNPDPGDKEEEI